jgi:hypothetical protein
VGASLLANGFTHLILPTANDSQKKSPNQSGIFSCSINQPAG